MTKTMPSAYGKRARKTTDATPKDTSPLTADELEEIARRRAEAARLALELADTISDEEDARLNAAAEADPDNPPLTDEDWKRMRPAHEVHPEWVARSLRRGRPKLADPKRQVTLRLDADVLDHFKASGSGWQTAINDVLRKAVGKAGQETTSPRAKRQRKAS